MRSIQSILFIIILNVFFYNKIVAQSKIFEKDGKFGVHYIDPYRKDTSLQIKPEYDQIYDSYEIGYILAKKDHPQIEGNIVYETEPYLPYKISIKAQDGWKIGMTHLTDCIDSTGLPLIVLPPRFISMEIIRTERGFIWVGHLPDRKVEVCTEFYNKRCTPKHKSIYFDSIKYVYRDLLAIVKKNGKYGVWDFNMDNTKKGRKYKAEGGWLFKPKYEAIEAVYKAEHNYDEDNKYVILYKIKQRGKWGYIDVNRNVKKRQDQKTIYDELIISDILNQDDHSIGMLTKIKDKKEVYIKHRLYNGNIYLMHFNPEGIEDIRQLGWYNSYGTRFRNAYYQIKKNGKWGVATWKEGETKENPYQVQWLFPCEYDSIELQKSAELILTQNNKKGVFKYNFEKSKIDTLLACQYQNIKSFKEIIQWHHRTYIKPLPSYLIQENDKWGIWISDSLQINIQPEYDSIVSYFSIPLWWIQKNGKWGLWDYNKKIVVLPPLYDSVSYFGGSTCLILNDGIYSTYNLETREIYPINPIETVFPFAWKVPIVNEGGMFYPNLSFLKKSDTLAIYFLGTDFHRQNSISSTLVNIGSGQIIELDKNKHFYFDVVQPCNIYNDKGIRIQQYLDNHTSLQGAKTSFPIFQDFNKDGQLDILIHYYHDPNYNPSIHYQILVLDGQTGNVLWNQGYGGGGQIEKYLLDVNNDQILDFCIAGSSIFSVIDGKNGQPILWENKMFAKDGQSLAFKKDSLRSILLVDNHYGKPIIKSLCLSESKSINTNVLLKTIVGAGSKFILVNTYNGATYFIPLPPNYWTNNERKSDTIINLIDAELPSQGTSSFIADILGNGQYQYGVVTSTNILGLYDENANIIEKLMLPANAAAPVYISDIDQDGFLEILIMASDGYLYCYKTKSKGKIWSGGLNCDKPVHQQVISLGN